MLEEVQNLHSERVRQGLDRAEKSAFQLIRVHGLGPNLRVALNQNMMHVKKK